MPPTNNNNRQDVRSKVLVLEKQVEEILERIKSLEDKMDAIRLELPEIRLIKKVFVGLIAFILTGFLGLVWNSVVLKTNTTTEAHPTADDITELKKILDEYQKDKR